jgi:hypothetical protein
MTLGNRGGEIVGTDEKETIRWVGEKLGLPNNDETVELMYPSTGKDAYDPNRAEEILPPPIGKATMVGGGVQPQPGQVQATVATDRRDDGKSQTPAKKEALRLAVAKFREALAAYDLGLEGKR